MWVSHIQAAQISTSLEGQRDKQSLLEALNKWFQVFWANLAIAHCHHIPVEIAILCIINFSAMLDTGSKMEMSIL